MPIIIFAGQNSKGDSCTSWRAAGTALWSFGLEPAGAVSPHAGDDPWCEEEEGCRDGSGPAGKRER